MSYIKSNGNGTYTLIKDNWASVIGKSVCSYLVSEAVVEGVENRIGLVSGSSKTTGDAFAEGSEAQIAASSPYYALFFKVLDIGTSIGKVTSGFNILNKDNTAFGLLEKAGISTTGNSVEALDKTMKWTYAFIDNLGYFNDSLGYCNRDVPVFASF